MKKVLRGKSVSNFVRFEVFTAVTMKNAVFWDVTLCGSYKSHTAKHPRGRHSSLFLILVTHEYKYYIRRIYRRK
jgi:hypothetical protein